MKKLLLLFVVALSLRAEPVYFTNLSTVPITFMCYKSGVTFPFAVPARETLKVDLGNKSVRDSSGFSFEVFFYGTSGFLYNMSVSCAKDDIPIVWFDPAGTIYSATGPYGFYVMKADESLSWDFIWGVVALGVGCMVVPASLSMAIRAVRRGLSHNIEPL